MLFTEFQKITDAIMGPVSRMYPSPDDNQIIIETGLIVTAAGEMDGLPRRQGYDRRPKDFTETDLKSMNQEEIKKYIDHCLTDLDIEAARAWLVLAERRRGRGKR
jgi:hypothetical protein